MNKTFLIMLAFLLFNINCNGQKESKIKIEKVYLNKNEKSKNCYTIVYPPKIPWKGFRILIPGFGETAENVFEQTDLPKELAENGILTIIPTFQDGTMSFGVDDLSQHTLDRIFKDVTSKHKLIDQNFFIGGFSIGGSAAIKYAENSNVKPAAVFAIDPPLDFERFYNSAKRDIRLSKDKEANPENVYMISRLEKETGGSPQTNLANYHSLSPYSYSDKAQTAVKKLINQPLRIYSEPDINWWLKERSADLTNMNVTECSAMVNELNRLGNNKAELIITQTKALENPTIEDTLIPGVLLMIRI